ncbi:MAG: peptidase [Lachnospiraceae bacterium]|nr:peptidase [Lachnospiraceae bacterium]
MNKFKIPRVFIIQMVCVFMFSALVYHMFGLQIVDGQDYEKEASQSFNKVVYEKGTRGNIYDCNGKVLAYNKMVYTVTMADTGKYSSAREKNLTLNSIIYNVVKRLEANNETVNNEIKIEIGKDGSYKYTVDGSLLDRFKADIFGEADPGSMTEEQKNITAVDMVKFLSGDSKFALFSEGGEEYLKEELEEYGLPDKFTKEEILTVTGIRYMLSLNAYRRYMPVVIARDVSEKTVVYIKENMAELTGLDTGHEWKRVYNGGEAFSHILGYTGKISAEELENYPDKDKGYLKDTIVGKTGIEQYMDDKLQGINGEMEIQVDNLGRKTGEEQVLKEMKSGKDVYLSVDKDLQIAIYNILEQKLAGIISSNLINARKFDKTNISDASDIRITIYDVYIALVENNVIKTEDLYSPGACKFEKHIAKILDKKYKKAVKNIKRDLSTGKEDFKDLSDELQDYEYFIVNKSGILDESLVDKEDNIYLKWKYGGKASTSGLLRHAIQKGWISRDVMKGSQQYITTDEIYQIIMDCIGERLEGNREFSKILFKYSILEGGITGIDIIKLLCRQGVLNTDSDYKNLMEGQISAFSYIKSKIEKLQITPAQLALDPCSASAVVVYEKSGKVAACVSYPGYDNNRLANNMDADYYNQLLNDKSLPLYNRATMQLTAPGSTFKPITIIAGIKEGVISPGTDIFCDGVFDKLSPSLRCWNHSGHGNVPDAATAVQFSCNDYLCEISYRMGILNGGEYNDKKALSKLQEYAELFHLDKKTGIEIAESEPHITDKYGIQSAIGQGTHNYSTVQLARYINSVATSGKVYALSLIRGVTGKNRKLTSNKTVIEDKIELPSYIWDVVHSGMEQFAENNTVLKDIKLKVAGKTGTAQESADRPDHSLFAGYAPADKPEISIAIRIANGYGSSNATAIGKDIFSYYFKLDNKKRIITGKASQAINTGTD